MYLMSLRRTLAAAGAVAVLIATAVPVSGQDVHNPARSSLAGARLFRTKSCSNCHAINGLGGGVGPDLGHNTHLRTFYELATAIWNHLPQMGARMDSLGISRPHLDAWQMGDIIAFLYSVHYFDAPGDSASGARLFRERNCITCHQVGGVGGVVGRNLDYFGHLGSPIQIATAMWNHGVEMTAAMAERGIERASFSGSELIDLIAYIRSVSPTLANGTYLLPGNAQQGRLLFSEKNCSRCHSVRGVGGARGPDLAEQGRHRSLTQFAAAMWNKAPSMHREMENLSLPLPQLEASEMADIVAYLYSVRYFRESGNADTGRRRLRDKGCLDCHSIDGRGGGNAPDLGQVRGLGSPPAVIAALWNHLGVDTGVEEAHVEEWPAIRPEEMADIVAFFRMLPGGSQ